MSPDIYGSVDRLRKRIVSRRLDDWWNKHRHELQLVSCAWISIRGARPIPVHVGAGNLASNPSAAVVSARSEGRYGGFLECEVGDLPQDFSAFRESPVGAVVPVGPEGRDLGIVFDRGPVQLDSVSRTWIEHRIFDEWVEELRERRKVVDLRNSIEEVDLAHG